ncbi:MAG: 3-hydroxyacyl-CoA dehydrogenase family protein [Candidatus Bathyarchaeia archaeon]
MKVEDIKIIGVLGLGTMGSGIAQVCATFGFKVIGRDLNDELLNRAKENIISGRFGLKTGLERGKVTKEQYEQALNNLKFTTSMEELCKNSDVIIECVPEILDLKLKVFREMDKLCPPHTILASNTSGYPITAMAGATDRPDKVIGMHWFNPAPVMRLIEVVKTKQTSEETVNCIKDLAIKLGKTPIVINDAPERYGFVANRAYAGLVRECRAIVEEGIATPEQVDLALKLGYGFPMGPFELTGLVGRLGREEKR